MRSGLWRMRTQQPHTIQYTASLQSLPCERAQHIIHVTYGVSNIYYMLCSFIQDTWLHNYIQSIVKTVLTLIHTTKKGGLPSSDPFYLPSPIVPQSVLGMHDPAESIF